MIDAECYDCGESTVISCNPWECQCGHVNEVNINDLISDLGSAIRRVDELYDQTRDLLNINHGLEALLLKEHLK